MKREQITGELLNRVISIYMEHAFKRHPEAFRNKPVFEPHETLPQILEKKHPFEDLTGGQSDTLVAPMPLSDSEVPRVYALRLGNDAYPHMKLAIVEAYFKNEFVFAVDRHDTFHFEPDVPGYQAWCQLKEINRILKEAIEDAWHKNGIPTLRGLREERFRRPELAKTMREEGHTLLVLDDDEARAEILKGILFGDGYDVVLGPPGPKPNLSDTAVHLAKEKARGASLRLPAEMCRGADDVRELCALIESKRVALVVLDVSYRTGQGPRVANALRLDSRSQDVPILAIYSRRDFGPDPDLFDTSLRRPYRAEALLELVGQTLVRRSRGASGIHKAIEQ